MKNTFRFLNRAIAQRNDESGHALVELALSTPLFMLVLLGAAEFARLTYAGIEVTNAARAGAQYAATLGGATSDTGGIQNAAQNDSYNLGSGVTTSVFSDTCVCSGAESTTVACTTTCPSGQHLMETVSIKATTSYDPVISFKHLFPGVGVDGPFTINAYAQQLVLPQ